MIYCDEDYAEPRVLPEPRLIGDIAAEILDEVESGKTLCELLKLSPLRPEQVVNPETCLCGGGCESLLECYFWYFLRKTPMGELGCDRQIQVGRFRVDALCNCDGESVVVELDGKQFHDADRDSRRDAILIQDVDAIIRIPFAAMHYHP